MAIAPESPRSLSAWSHLIYSLSAPLGSGLAFRTSVKGVIKDRNEANSTARDNRALEIA